MDKNAVSYRVCLIVMAYQDGMISRDECVERLELLRVRGAFRTDNSYIGYDYGTQQWVEVAA